MNPVVRQTLLSKEFRIAALGVPVLLFAGAFENVRDIAAQTPVKPVQAPQRLFAELKSDDPLIRRAAANEFGSMRAKSGLRSLISTLSDKDANVREAAAFALGQLTEPRATDALVKVMSDSNSEVRASAAFALGMLGEQKGARALSAALDDNDPAVRSCAITGLGLMQESESTDEIIQMLSDSSFDVRYDAVWALGYLGEPEAASHLRAALINLDLISIDDGSREAFRQAVQQSLENLRTGDDTQARPRRANRTEVLSQTNRPAAIRKSVSPAATERAGRAGIRGSVGLRVLVGADGRAVRAYVAKRLGYGLDQRAVEAVLQYRFDPALLSGMPQTTWMEIQIKF